MIVSIVRTKDQNEKVGKATLLFPGCLLESSAGHLAQDKSD